MTPNVAAVWIIAVLEFPTMANPNQISDDYRYRTPTLVFTKRQKSPAAGYRAMSTLVRRQNQILYFSWMNSSRKLK